MELTTIQRNMEYNDANCLNLKRILFQLFCFYFYEFMKNIHSPPTNAVVDKIIPIVIAMKRY